MKIMKKNIYLTVTFICVIFLSGAAAGFFTGRMTASKGPRRHRKWRRSREEIRAFIRKKICRRLAIKTEQEKTVLPMIDSWLEDMDKLRAKHAPQYKEVFEKFYNKIAPVLSASQKEKLDEMRKKITKHSPPPPPPPPPPSQSAPQPDKNKEEL